MMMMMMMMDDVVDNDNDDGENETNCPYYTGTPQQSLTLSYNRLSIKKGCKTTLHYSG